jgi:hypothetical protein
MLGDAADAGGTEFKILGVDGVCAAELFVAGLLPFGGKGGVDDFLRGGLKGRRERGRRRPQE